MDIFLINLFYFLGSHEKCVFRFDNVVFYFVKKLQQIAKQFFQKFAFKLWFNEIIKERTICLVRNKKQFYFDFDFYVFLNY